MCGLAKKQFLFIFFVATKTEGRRAIKQRPPKLNSHKCTEFQKPPQLPQYIYPVFGQTFDFNEGTAVAGCQYGNSYQLHCRIALGLGTFWCGELEALAHLDEGSNLWDCGFKMPGLIEFRLPGKSKPETRLQLKTSRQRQSPAKSQRARSPQLHCSTGKFTLSL